MSIRRRNPSPVGHRFHFSWENARARWPRMMALVLVAGALTPAGVLLGAAASATGCRPGIGQSIFASSAPLDNRIGDSIDYDVEISLTTNDCPISNGTVTLTLPNGSVQTLASGTLSLAPGGVVDYDEETLGLPLYVISAADLDATDEVTATATTNATATESTDPLITQPVKAIAPFSIQVARPETTLTKSASPTTGRSPLTVTYTFNEKNISPDTDPHTQSLDAITGASIVITDSDPGCVPAPETSGGFNMGDTNDNGLLDVGETWVYSCTETLTDTGSTVSTFSDTATATGTAEDGLQAGTPASQGAPAQETSGAAVVTVRNPAASLTETASPTLVRTGSPVTFTYKEKNTGSDPFSGVTVTGSSCGAATLVSSSDGNTTVLNPGATWTFTCTETLTNSSTTVKTVTDTASVTGTDVTDGNPGPAETAQASVMVLNPATSLTETASPTLVRTGSPVTFTYKEKNTGSDPFSGVTVTGSSCGPATFVSSSDGNTTVLNPGATWIFTLTETLTNSSTTVKTVTDTASVTGTDVTDGNPGPVETSQASVMVSDPSTVLTETASPTLVRTGSPVTFTYKEKSTGSDPLSGVTVTGSSCGAATFVSSSDGNTTVLNPGATWTFTCTEILTNSGTSVKSVTDTASVTGTDVTDGNPGPAETAQASVMVLNPATSLTETASPTLVRTGSPVTFTYKEKNTGSDPFSGVTVVGSSCGAATLVSSSDGNTTVLNPGATWTFTCTEILTNSSTTVKTVTTPPASPGPT